MANPKAFYSLIPNIPLFIGPSSTLASQRTLSLTFYESGTTTLQNIFQDPSLHTPALNPLPVPSSSPIYLSNTTYRVTLTETLPPVPPSTTPVVNVIYTLDPVFLPLNTTYSPLTPQSFGAKGDGVILQDAVMSSITNPHILSSPSASFTPLDVSKRVAVLNAGASSATLLSSITQYLSPTSVQLADPCLTTITASQFAYGTDDASPLTKFFAAIKGGAGAFQTGCVYLSSTLQTPQYKSVNYNLATLVFLVPNHSDDCLTFTPPVRGTKSQITSRMCSTELWVNAMRTGRYAVRQNDGSHAFYTRYIENSYDTAFYMKCVQDPSILTATYMENLFCTDILELNCGRHGWEIYLAGDGTGTSSGGFCNETNIFGWEIRGVGEIFGSGGAGTATASNGLRYTYDNVKNVNICKIGHFLVHGMNWDCEATAASGSVGDCIFQNAINGTTGRRVEGFQVRPGGIESTATAVTNAKFINGNAIVAGDWVECDIDQGQVFAWGIGVPNAMLVDPTDNNTYIENSPNRGVIYRAALGRPTPSPFPSTTEPFEALACGDAPPLGSYLSGNFRNSLVVSQIDGNIAAGSTTNFVVAFSNPLGKPVAQDFAQWPLLVTICNIPQVADLTKASYAEFLVLISEQQSSNTVFVQYVVKYQNTSSDYTYTFTPTSVVFSVTGTNNESLTIGIPGGINVGAAGSSPRINIWVGRPFSTGNRSRNTTPPGTVSNLAMGI